MGGEVMAFDGNVVCDADMHVLEPPDLWQRYIADEYKHAAPVGMTELQRDLRVRVKSQILLKTGPVRPLRERSGLGIGWREDQDEAYASAEARGWDAVAQLEAMDREGVDLAVLYPSRGLFVLCLDSTQQIGADGLEPDFAAAIARAYNDWLHDFCQHDPERLHGCAMVAPHHPEAAADEVARCVEEYGFKSVFLHPGCVNRRPWHDPAYDVLWAACERHGVPVGFHGGGRSELTPDYSLGSVFGDRLMMWHTFNQPLGVMAAGVSMIGGGVLERFPRLKVALLEGNCSWAPWLIHRLDEHYEWVGWYEARDLSRNPSEYFKRNRFVSVEVDEDPVRYYVDAFGDDNIVFSTDFPHGDAQYPHAVETFRKLPLSEESMRKVAGDNWSRLYDIPLVRRRSG
jgi:predicted TIM-barrel fold metal-dependent hydrolase